MTYDHSNLQPLNNAERQTIQGTRIDDGCSFTYSGEVSADFRGAIVHREIAYDSTTCKSVVETGTLTPEQVVANDLADLDTQQSNTALTKSVEWTGYWRDPLGIKVNWNRSNLYWRYDVLTSQVLYANSSCPDDWYTPTRWHREYDSGCLKSYQNNPSAVSVKSSRTYDNDVFICGPFLQGATTRIHDHEVVGRGSGSYSYSSNMYKSGDCAWLLWNEGIFVVL